MRSVIFHVGMHKTGSTAIQKILEGYAREGVEYLMLPPIDPALRHRAANHSSLLYLAYSKRYHFTPGLDLLGLSEDEIDSKRIWCQNAISFELSRSKARVVVVSAENALDIEEDGLCDIRDVFLRYFDEVRVYAYIRDPLGFVKSATNQIIKTGYGGDSPHSLRYREYFKKIEDVFGRGNVNYRMYDRNNMTDGNVVADFYEWIGFNSDDVQPLNVNYSLSTAAIRCMYALNRSLGVWLSEPTMKKAQFKVIEVVSNLLPGDFHLPREILEPVLDLDDLEWMSERVGRSLTPNRPMSGEAEPKSISMLEYLTEMDSSAIKAIQGVLYERGVGADCGQLSLQELMIELYFEVLRDLGGDPYDYRLFNADQYLTRYPDVKAAKIHPFSHYLLWGKIEGRTF